MQRYTHIITLAVAIVLTSIVITGAAAAELNSRTFTQENGPVIATGSAVDTTAGTGYTGASSDTTGTVSASSSASTPVTSKIRIGTTKPGQISSILLNKKGTLADTFAKNGVTTKFVQYNTDNDVINALSEGSIDIAYTSADPALIATAGGADIRLIGLASSNPVSPSTIVVLPNNKLIFFVSDLKGKKVAYLSGTENQAFLYQALKQKGLSFKDITQVNIDYKTAYPKLLTGDIDAIVADYDTVYGTLTFDQQVAESQRVITGRVITSGKEHPDWALPAVITANGKFAESHPDYVKSLLAQDQSDAAWVDRHYQKAVKVIAVATNQKETAVLKQYPSRVFYLNPTLTDSALNRLKGEEKFLNLTAQIGSPINWKQFVTSGNS